RALVTRDAFTHAAILCNASGSRSEGWKTRLGKFLAKWTTCSPEPLAVSRMTPFVGRTSRRTPTMKSRLRSVAGAYWRGSFIWRRSSQNSYPLPKSVVAIGNLTPIGICGTSRASLALRSTCPLSKCTMWRRDANRCAMMSPATKPDSADDDKRTIGRFREGFPDPAVILRRRRRQHSAGDLPSSLSPERQESAHSGSSSRAIQLRESDCYDGRQTYASLRSKDQGDNGLQFPPRAILRGHDIVVSAERQFDRQLAPELDDPARNRADRHSPFPARVGFIVGDDRRRADEPAAAKIVVDERLREERRVALAARARVDAAERPDLVDQQARDDMRARMDDNRCRAQAPDTGADGRAGRRRELDNRAGAHGPAAGKVSGREERRVVGRREGLRYAWERRQVRIPDDGDDRAVDEVPILVEMDRDHRLEFEDVLCALVRPDVEVGVVLERQDGEIADRILRLLGDIRLVGLGDGIVVDARAGRLVRVRRR